jgi:AI-2 transport protein TqsA
LFLSDSGYHSPFSFEMSESSSPSRSSAFRRLITAVCSLGISIAIFYILSIGRHFFVPLIISFLAVYLVDILSRLVGRVRIAGHRIPKLLTVVVSFVLIFGIGLALASVVANNAIHVAAAAPKYQARLQQLQSQIFSQFGWDEPPELFDLFRAFDLKAIFTAVAKSVADLLESTTLVVIYSLFILLELRFLPAKLMALFPNPGRRHRVVHIIQRIDRDIHTYLGVKTAVSLTTAVLAYILMRVVGLDFAEFWALLIFILHFIPTIGVIVATLLPTLLAAIQFDHIGPCLIIGIGLTAIAMFMGNIVEPNVMGETLNLSPLTVIIALIVWGTVWGVVGAFLCVPLTVILVIVMSNFESTRWVSILLSKTGKLHMGDPSSTVRESMISNTAKKV